MTVAWLRLRRGARQPVAFRTVGAGVDRHDRDCVRHARRLPAALGERAGHARSLARSGRDVGVPAGHRHGCGTPGARADAARASRSRRRRIRVEGAGAPTLPRRLPGAGRRDLVALAEPVSAGARSAAAHRGGRRCGRRNPGARSVGTCRRGRCAVRPTVAGAAARRGQQRPRGRRRGRGHPDARRRLYGRGGGAPVALRASR